MRGQCAARFRDSSDRVIRSLTIRNLQQEPPRLGTRLKKKRKARFFWFAHAQALSKSSMVCGSRALQSTPPRALGVPLAKANGPLRPAPAPRQVAVPESRCGATRGLSPHRVRWRFWRIIFYHARHRLRGGEGDKGVRPTLGSKRRMALCPLFYIRSRIDSTERRSPRWGWLGFLCPTYYSFRVHAFEGGPHEGALSYVLRPSSRISYHAEP